MILRVDILCKNKIWTINAIATIISYQIQLAAKIIIFLAKNLQAFDPKLLGGTKRWNCAKNGKQTSLNLRKWIESLPQTLILQSLYLCNPVS